MGFLILLVEMGGVPWRAPSFPSAATRGRERPPRLEDDFVFMELSGCCRRRWCAMGNWFLGHNGPQDRGSNEIERGQPNEKRCVSNCGHQRADDKIEDEQSGVAAGPSQAGHGRDFTSF